MGRLKVDPYDSQLSAHAHGKTLQTPLRASNYPTRSEYNPRSHVGLAG